MTRRYPTKMHGKPPCRYPPCATDERPPTRQEQRSVDDAVSVEARQLADDIIGMMRGDEPALLRNMRSTFGDGRNATRKAAKP